MSYVQEILQLIAMENLYIINLLEKKKNANRARRKIWVHDYFNRKNAVVAFKNNLSTMKMAGK